MKVCKICNHGGCSQSQSQLILLIELLSAIEVNNSEYAQNCLIIVIAMTVIIDVITITGIGNGSISRDLYLGNYM